MQHLVHLETAAAEVLDLLSGRSREASPRWSETPGELYLRDEVAVQTRVPREDSRPTGFVAEGLQARWNESLTIHG